MPVSDLTTVSAHYGKFSGISNYLAMIGPKSDEHLDEKIGYYGERLVLEAQMVGLNSCWVGLTFKKAFMKQSKRYAKGEEQSRWLS